MRYAIRLFKQRPATPDEVADWFKRFKLIGSALSTTRMCLRLCMGLDNFNFFLKMLRAYRQNKPLDTMYNIVIRFFYFWSNFFDNWFYLIRVGMYVPSSPAESTRISRSGTSCTIICYTMELWREYTEAMRKSNGDKQKFREIIYERRWFILSKLLEYPMQTYYLNLADFQIERGNAHALSLGSPVLYMLKKFGFLRF